MTQEEISYVPSIEKEFENLKENKVESTDIFSERNMSQIKDRKYENYYLNHTTRKMSQWRQSISKTLHYTNLDF